MEEGSGPRHSLGKDSYYPGKEEMVHAAWMESQEMRGWRVTCEGQVPESLMRHTAHPHLGPRSG